MAQVESVELAVDEPLDDEATEAKPSKLRLGKLKLPLIIVAAVLLVAGATLTALYFLGTFTAKSASATPESAPVETVAEPLAPAVYVDLSPSFTVNFQGQGGARFLQISLTAMTRDPDVEKLIKQHMPVIRNDLNLLFGDQDSIVLGTKKGKEALRDAALKAVQDILENETGEPGVEAIYFTSFVMQ